MIDIVLVAAASLALAVFFAVHYYVAAALGFGIGLFFGGLSIIFNILPALVFAFGLPVAYSFYFSVPLQWEVFLISSTALLVGYVAGSMVSIIFLPFKILGKIFKTITGLF